MDRTVRDIWTTALRSGKYKAAGGAFKGTRDGQDGYCCLGVLCLALKEANALPASVTVEENEINLIFTYHGIDNYGFFSAEAQELLGLPDRIQQKLAGMNDDQVSFETIADEIERVL